MARFIERVRAAIRVRQYSLLLADGNRCVAFFATDVFLRLNGWRMQVEAQAAYQFLMTRFKAGTCDFEHLLPGIRRGLVQL